MNWYDQVELFVSFSTVSAELGSLKLNDEQLICLYKECLVWSLFLEDMASAATVYLSLGGLHRKKNRIPKAIECYNSYLTVTKDMREVQTLVYMILGNIYYSLHEYHKAMEHFTSGLDIAIEFGDKENERFALHNLGGVYYNLEDYEMAMQYYEKSLEIAKQHGNKTWQMEAYENLGAVCLYALEKYHAAIEYCEQCLSIATEIDEGDFKHRMNRNLATAYQKTKQYAQAIRFSKNHLEIAIKSGDKKGQYQNYFRLGSMCKTLGKYHEAIGYYKKYLDISIDMEDQVSEADACGKLAIANRSVCRYNEAIRYHDKAVNITRQLQNKEGEGIVIGSLANTYTSLGQYREAIECAQKSLNLARETGNREIEGNALGQLGNVYHKSAEFDKAIDFHKKSLEISIEIGDKNAQGKTYGNLGLGYTSLGNNEKAIEYHEKNLNVAIETGDREGQVNPYGHLGNIYRLTGQYEKSIDVTQKSLELAKELDDKEGQAGACYLLAHCYYVQSCKQHDDASNGKDRFAFLKEAEKYLKESIRCYEWMFDHLEDQDQFKISIVDTFVFAYKLLTRVYIETQQNQQALLTCERGRARALSDLLTTKYNMDTSLPQTRISEYCDVEGIMTTSSSCILFFGIIMKPHRTIDNCAAEGCVATWIVTADKPLITTLNEDIETSSLQPDENVNKLVSQAFDELKVRQAVVCEDRSLDTSDTTPDVRCAEDVDYDDSPLEELFELFLSPVLDKLTQDEIVVIPDGPLFTVPYAALRDPKTNKYLSESKRIRLAPSLATLKILKESSADSHSTTGALIVGNPTVGKVEFRGEVKHYHDLPGAEREAEVIGEMLGVTPITGQQATKQAIKERLREGVALIHFAAHGSSEGEIALTPNPTTCNGSIPQEDDYLLTMQDVQEIGISAQLVVLSCCHSGRGEIKSEGVVGMSRAFLAAGARSVVGSLWAIADGATMVFMDSFYTHLKQGESASVSLHKTIQDMRYKYSEPMFWAPFFLIGDDVTINL